MAKSELARQIFRDIVGYTDDVIRRANEAAEDIQKNMMLPEVEAASPVRGNGNTQVSIKGALAPVPSALLSDKKQMESGGFAKSWATRTMKNRNGSTVYAVYNKQSNLTHLLNFDHRHFSHGRFTGMTHQAHAGFVDTVQRHAEEELNRRIEEIIEGGE